VAACRLRRSRLPEPVHILVEVRHLPTTLLKAVVQLRSGFPLLCMTPSSVRWEVTMSRITRSLRKQSPDRYLWVRRWRTTEPIALYEASGKAASIGALTWPCRVFSCELRPDGEPERVSAELIAMG
jgi:hypothetical protein